jgi:hypothetical protein
MNDVDKPMHLDADSLDEFERQLRSLAPRDAKVELAALRLAPDSQPVVLNQPSAEFPVVTAINRVRWAAALLLTWSLGAAAGIGGTLVCTRWLPGNAPVVAQTAVVAPVDESTADDPTTDMVDPPLAANIESSPSDLSPTDLSPTELSRTELSATELSAGELAGRSPQSWPQGNWGWPLRNWNDRAIRSRSMANAAIPLSPIELAASYTNHSPSWRAGLLDPFVMSRSQLRFSDAPSDRATPAADGSTSEAAAGAIEAGRMDPSQVLPVPPTNQRDLLQQLLSTQRAI